MSADNGVYILHTKDGYRVAERQGIDNIYWWYKDTECCDSIDIDRDQCRCKNCNSFGMEERSDINPAMLVNYFGSSEIYQTSALAFGAAEKKYDDAMRDLGIVEYGICKIEAMDIDLTEYMNQEKLG